VRTIGAARQVSFKDAYLRYWLRWSDYRGRSSRQEYWKWFLVDLVVVFVLNSIGAWIGVIFGIVSIAPTLTLTVRRLHDAGHTGKWVAPLIISYVFGLWVDIFVKVGSSMPSAMMVLVFLLLLASIITGIVVFIFSIQRSKPDNAWGLEPQ
jgi:uncharacterized membrane protein YhaH (DUF805 family)